VTRFPRRLRIPGPPIRLAVLSIAATVLAYFCAIWIERGSLPAASAETLLPGLTLGKERSSAPGLIVTSVRFDGEAKRKGVSVGDQILSINGIAAQAGKRSGHYFKARDNRRIKLELLHDGSLRRITLDHVQDKANGSEDPARRG
jgi:predicted metalloprotease with PDZ domain